MNDNELFHYGVKGQKWGIINDKDDQDHRLASEKENLKYDYKNREAKMFYENQSKKDKLDYKRDIALAKIEEKINNGKQLTERAISNNVRLGEKYKANAKSISAIALALSASSIGNSFKIGMQSKGMSDTYIKNDYRHDYTSYVNNQQRTNKTYNEQHGLVNVSKPSNQNVSNYANLLPENLRNNLMLHGLDLSKIISDDLLIHAIWDPKEHPRDKSGRFIESGSYDNVNNSKTIRFKDKNGNFTNEGILKYYGRNYLKQKTIKETSNMLKKDLENSEKFKSMSEEEKQKKYNEIDKYAASAAEEKISELEGNLKFKEDAANYTVQKIESGKKILENTTDIFNKISNVVPNVPGKSIHPNYEDISTEELIKRTNRLNAENNYARASGEMIYVPSKQELTRERLQTIGAVSGILASMGGVVLTVSQLKYGTKRGKG